MRPTIRQRVRWWLNARRQRKLDPPNMSELPWMRDAMEEQTGEIFDARTWGRWAARRRFMREHDWAGKPVVLGRFARLLTTQEIWAARDREEEWKVRLEHELDEVGEPEERLEELLRAWPVPAVPPAGWEPDEYDPAWEFCEFGAPGAAPVWFVEYEGA